MGILALLSFLLLLSDSIHADLPTLQPGSDPSLLPKAGISVPLSAKVPRRNSKKNARADLRGKQSRSDTVHVDGSFDNEYLVNITVGGHPFQVILDTGSSDIWVTNDNFTCVDANRNPVTAATCNFGPAKFDPGESATFELFPNTTFFVQYGSGEFLRGPAGFDTIAIGDLAVTHQEFGVPGQNHFFGDGVSEGVIGLAFSALTSVYNATSQNPYTPFFLNAVQQNGLKRPYFSLSLNRPTFEQATNDPFIPNLGLLAFGGTVDVPVLNTSVMVPIQGYMSTSSVPSNSSDARFLWYTIDIDAYTFPGSNSVPTNSNNTILDSGSTFNWVPTAVAAAYNALFTPPATLDDDLMYVVPCNATAPAFAVVVGGKSFVIDPRDQVVLFELSCVVAICELSYGLRLVRRKPPTVDFRPNFVSSRALPICQDDKLKTRDGAVIYTLHHPGSISFLQSFGRPFVHR
ncbi:aspartic peptidase domain-containing protein [Mycena albidolilacea]|uniref:Aspartic peptidase domain-containing protein n=1 Tax=Mycena albidolilacea TaxID=1033008 RepID=A0AAD6ZUI2_9AGAR|nr:aspartic peptidase domain-containing protein [Mycena albidolilacea]